MKLFLLVFLSAISLLAANEKENQTTPKQLSMSSCIPHRSSTTGEIDRYVCDDSKSKQIQGNSMELSAVLKNAKPQEFEYLGKMKKTEVRHANPIEVDNTSKANDFISQIDNKIKSCLANVYSAQAAYLQSNGNYATDYSQLNLTNSTPCNGLEVSSEQSSSSEFKMIAKRGALSWSVDNEKRMTKLY